MLVSNQGYKCKLAFSLSAKSLFEEKPTSKVLRKKCEASRECSLSEQISSGQTSHDQATTVPEDKESEYNQPCVILVRVVKKQGSATIPFPRYSVNATNISSAMNDPSHLHVIHFEIS